MKPCNKNIQKAIELTGDMIRLADRGDSEREDAGCGILYGIIRDSAYKIQKAAEKEKAAHIDKGYWSEEPDSENVLLKTLYNSATALNLDEKEMPVKGSQTEKNLLSAFAGESQTSNRYFYFAGQAEKEGYNQIASIFIDTANQEKEHARLFLMYLEGGEVEISGSFPAIGIGNTFENLNNSAMLEEREHAIIYPAFAYMAKKEGFEAVAFLFEAIATAEKQHDKRFKELARNIQNGNVFRKNAAVLWRCINCGYAEKSLHAPEKCPACDQSKAYFEIMGENW